MLDNLEKLVDRFEIKEHNFKAAFGEIMTSRVYKKTQFTDEMIEQLKEEAKSSGWDLPEKYKENVVDDAEPVEKIHKIVHNNKSINIAVYPEIGDALFSDDHSVAVFYVYKNDEARKRNIDFSLSFSDFKRLLNRKTCYYTGICFENIHGSRFKVTLDRIDNSIGYTKENTIACCWFVNQLKNELFEKPDGNFRITKSQLTKLLSKLN